MTDVTSTIPIRPPFQRESMKLHLTPDIAYLIGVWKGRRTIEGIGIREASAEMREEFVRQLLKQKIMTADKIRLEPDKVFFYHSAYRVFFQEVNEQELDRFGNRNDYSSAFLAGLFDSVGGFTRDGSSAYFESATRNDEMLLLRLNFKATKRGKRVFILNPAEFLSFIKPHRKVFFEVNKPVDGQI